MKKTFAQTIGAFAVAALSTVSAFAQTTGMWNVDADGNWSTPGNWSGGVPSLAGDTASLTYNLTAARTVTLDTPETVGVLNLGDPTSGFFGYTLSGSSALTFNNNGSGAQVNQLTAGGASDTISAPISLADNLAITNVNGLTLSGVIDGSGSMTKAGTGTLTLSGASTYGGGTTLSAGTLLVQGSSTLASGTVASGPLGAGPLTLNGGTFGFVGGGYTIANNVSIGGAANIEVASGQNEVLNGDWSGSGNITLVANGSTGQWQFGGDNSGYAGSLTQNGGNTSLAFNSTNSGSASAAWIFNNNVNQRTRLNFGAGTISFGSLAGNGSIANVAASGTATVSVGALNGSTTFSGVLGGSSAGQGQNINLLKVGTGTLTLTAANTYTGSTMISAGTLTISGAGQLGGGYYSGSIVNNATLNFSGTASQTLAGPISGSGTLTLSGGNLVLACSQSFSLNAVGVNDGATLNETFSPSVQMTAGSVTAGLTTGATLGFVANSTSLARISVGTLTLNGANTINIIGGNLAAGSSYPLIAYTTLAGAGSYALGALPPGVAGNLSTSGNTIYFNVTGVTNTIWTGTVNGTWDINTTANWTNAGTLGTTYVDGSPVQFDDTGLNTTTISNSVATTLSPISVLVTNNVNNYAFKANTIIAGAASLTKAGTANLTNATPNTYTGPTVINQGHLVVGVASVANVSGALGKNSAVSLANDSTAGLNLNNFATQIGSLSGGGSAGGNVALGSATLTLGADNSSTAYAGTVSGTGGLTKIGTGTLTLNGTNLYTGTTLIAQGAVVLNGNGTLGAPAAGYIRVGNTTGQAGAMYQSGANTVVSNSTAGLFGIATAAGAYGYYNLAGGTINTLIEIDPANGGTGDFGQFDMSGGTVNISSGNPYFLPCRNGNGESSVVNISGGTVQIAGGATPGDNAFNGLSVNWGNTGAAADTSTITISGGGQFLFPSLRTKLNQGSSFKGTTGNSSNVCALNLNGGTFQTLGFLNGTGNNPNVNVNFNGGALKAGTAANASYLSGLGGLYVYGNGGTFDNNGLAISIGQAFLSPTASGVASIAVGTAGSGYLVPPKVTIVGDGAGATAYATIDPASGAVTGIVVTCPGTGYSTASASLAGGGGSGATAGAVTLAANTSGPMIFTGAGTTTLTGVNTYTGGTKVLGGTLVINTATGGAQGGGDLAVSNAALNVIASGGTALSAGNLELQGTNVLSFAPSPSAADGSGTCINLGGTLSNTGTNYVHVSGIGLSVGVYHLITAASGTVSTNHFVLAEIPPGAQGMLTNSTPTTLDFVVTSIGQVLSWFGNPSSTPAPWDIGITADWTPDHGGSLTTYNEYFTNTMGDLVAFGQDGANTTDTNYVDLETAVVPASVTFNWIYPYVLTGAGSIGGITSLVITDAPAVYLGTRNSYTGGTFVYGGSLTITNDNALGVSSNGVTLGSDSFGASTLQLNGVTSARNISLVGNSSIGVASNTASVLSGNINGSGTLTKSDYGALTLLGNITNTGSLDFLTGTGAISGTVSLGGELWAGASSDSNSFGVLNIQPGANVTVASWIVAGRGGYGILNVNGGILTKGGDNNTHLTMTGAGSGETGILNLNSGLIQDATGDCWLGEQFTSIVNQNGGTLANTGGSVYLGRYVTADSTYNLNGGLLQTRSVIGNFVAVSNSVFNFNGGTLQPVADSSAFMQGLTAAHVTANGAIIDTTNFNITISQALADDPINGPGRLVKLGAGVLTLSGSNTISGPVTVNLGTLFVTPADQGANAVTVADGAAYGVQLTGDPGSVTNAAITLNSGSTTLAFNLGANGNPTVPLIVCGALTNNGTLSVTLGANSSLLTVGSAIPLVKYSGAIAGAGSMNSMITGPRGSSITLSNDTSGRTLYAVINALGGGIVWTGTNSAAGLTNLWDLNLTTNWLFGVLPTDYQETIPPGDAVVFNDLGSGTVLLSNTVNPTSVTISNSAVNYTFQGTGQINSLGGLTKVGSGTATLNLSGTYSLSTVVSNGTLNLGANQTFANLTGDGTISTASGSPTLTENSSADTAFAGQVQGALNLTKNGTASLTLSGAANHTMANLSVNEGALGLPGGNVSVSGRAIVGNWNTAGALTLSGGAAISTATGSFDIGNSDSGGAYTATGMVTVASGATLMVGGSGSPGHYQSGGLNIGNGYNVQALCNGAMLVNGGNVWVTNDAIIGFAGASLGTLTISNGTFNVGPVNTKWFKVSQWDSSKGVVNIAGGALNLMNGSSIKFSTGNTSVGGTINQSGGNVTFYSDAGTQVGGGGTLDLEQHGPATVPPINTYNLDGGVLTVPQIISSQTAGTRLFNFNGGTLRAAGSSATFFASGVASSANVLSGGAIVDTSSNNITIGQALINNGVDQDGGLTKNGNGTLELNGVNTYTNVTSVNGGLLGGSGTITGAVIVNSGGGLAPGSGGVGALTINGNITLNANSTNVFEVDGTSVTNDQVVAGAGVNYGGVLNIVPSGTFAIGQTFTLFSGAGAASASNFASIAGSPGAGLAFSFTNGVLSVVAGGPGGPANLTNSYDAGTHTLSLSWPANQGWRLQMQTNSLSIGLSNNWIYVTDGSISSTNITVDPTQPTVFYRLRYP